MIFSRKYAASSATIANGGIEKTIMKIEALGIRVEGKGKVQHGLELKITCEQDIVTSQI